MAPTAREVILRVEAGLYVRPADVRAAVAHLNEAYEGLRSAVEDGIHRRLPLDDAQLYAAEAVVDGEWLLRKASLADVRCSVTAASAALERVPVVPAVAGAQAES